MLTPGIMTPYAWCHVRRLIEVRLPRSRFLLAQVCLDRSLATTI